MKLSNEGLKNRQEWTLKRYELPAFDREAMRKETLEAPVWIHFGAGNIFRAFHANLAQRLLNDALTRQGILVVEGFDYEIIEKQYQPHDYLSVYAELHADGTVRKKVIGSIASAFMMDPSYAEEYEALKNVFRAPSLQMATFTITEKGYNLKKADGTFLPAVEADFAAGPDRPSTYMAKVTALLYERYKAGRLPLAMVSTDNCSHNGSRLYEAVETIASHWTSNGLADAGFLDYVKDGDSVSFPWTMIDKITPRPDAAVEEMLRKDGLEDLEPVVTKRHSYVAPFVNAEESEYLVIEDRFPNGRPPLEKEGVIFTSRETVDKVEKMKVCTCLNPLHTALAVYGCLLGYTKISDEAKDPELSWLMRRIGYTEGLPVVTDPGVIHPREFIDTVVNVRIPNPYMPDTPQRIATDTSQKLSIRYGETIKAYIERGLDLGNLVGISLVLAGWLRYLMAVDDEGKAFEPSPDPLLAQCQAYVKNFKIGDSMEEGEALERLSPLLSNASIFGLDLTKTPLARRVAEYFAEEIKAPGAVRAVLKVCRE